MKKARYVVDIILENREGNITTDVSIDSISSNHKMKLEEDN